MKKASIAIGLFAAVCLMAGVFAWRWLFAPDLRTFSEGDRAGILTKLSYRSTYDAPKIRQGCTNWEGELAMANAKIMQSAGDSPTISGGNTFEFSLPKRSQDAQYSTSEDAVQQALHRAELTQHRLLLHYVQVARHDACASRTDYLIVGVQDLDVPDYPILAGRMSPLNAE